MQEQGKKDPLIGDGALNDIISGLDLLLKQFRVTKAHPDKPLQKLSHLKGIVTKLIRRVEELETEVVTTRERKGITSKLIQLNTSSRLPSNSEVLLAKKITCFECPLFMKCAPTYAKRNSSDCITAKVTWAIKKGGE